MSWTGPTVVLIGPNHMFRELLANHVRESVQDFDVLELSSLNTIECQSVPANAVVVLIDSGQEWGEFPQMVRDARSLMPHRPVALISGVRGSDRRALLDLDIDGFISTRMPVDAIRHALRFLLAGGGDIPPGLLETPNDELGGDLGPTETAQVALPALTGLEIQILRCLLQGKPNKTIGADLDLSESSIKSRIRGLMRKFGVHNRVELVLATAGIRLDQEEPHRMQG